MVGVALLVGMLLMNLLAAFITIWLGRCVTADDRRDLTVFRGAALSLASTFAVNAVVAAIVFVKLA